MNVLDWLLIVLVLAYALSGYWQGFVTGAMATAGLLLGGLTGVWLAPFALGDAHPSLLVSLGALFIVIVCATLGQAFFQYGGARLRETIRWQPFRAVDAVGGADAVGVDVGVDLPRVDQVVHLVQRKRHGAIVPHAARTTT